MNHLWNYYDFIKENKNISLSISIETLLSMFNDKVDIFKIFSINKEQVNINSDIQSLFNNNGFNKTINEKGYKKGKLEDTTYDQTLLDDTTILKFFFLYKKSAVEIEEPECIILQYTKNGKNSDILSYDNKIYEKLTDSTIELKKGDNTYLYKTTNGGNNWEMKNVQMEDNIMKSELDKDKLLSLIKKYNITLL